MKRLLWTVALLTAFVFTMDAQNNYSRLWSKVQKAEKEGKPQTAAGYLRELEQKTIKAGDELEQLVVSENLYNDLKDKVDFRFDTPVASVERVEEGYRITTGDGQSVTASTCVISVGRSGSKWMEGVCQDMGIPTKSNRVDIGVRVELPAKVFQHLTDELYESKIVYRTAKFEDLVRTFCMNPHGAVVSENTNGIVTVNGHSFEDPARHTDNTNFALLVSKHFSEPFKDSNGYGESIARLAKASHGSAICLAAG